MDNKKKKILFIVQHRENRSPGQRFRIEQFLKRLDGAEFSWDYSYILSNKDDIEFYREGRYLYKLWILIKSIFIRFIDVFRSPGYDIIFIYREAIMIGNTFFERLFKLSGAKIILDFDDSIWLNDTSEGNKNLKWLKRPKKIKKIISLADKVIVGNEYLYNYSVKYNSSTVIIPTVLDTTYHKPIYTNKGTDCVNIGWTGTATTIKHFESIIPILKRIKEKYGDKVRFTVICNINYSSSEIPLKSVIWKTETEIEDLSEFDIGIMPLPDDDWSKGKCGFKGLQYMALEIPAVMSAVGVNSKIIENGVNGFLASKEEDWFEILSKLIESEVLRKYIGKKGRETVINSFSLDAYYEIFSEILRYL